MIRRIAALGVAGLTTLLALSVSNQAQAEGRFGSRGQFVVSLDRTMGLNFHKFKTKYKNNNPSAPAEWEWEDSDTQFNLLWSSSSVTHQNVEQNGGRGDQSIRPNIGAIPRFSFDYLVIDGLSLGLSLGYMSVAGTNNVESLPPNVPRPPEHDHTSARAFAFAPRIGYIFMFNDLIGMWPRAGVTYFNYSAETKHYNGQNAVDYTYEESYSGLDLNLEFMLAISPVPHVAFLVGPVFDIGLTGSVDPDISPPPANYIKPDITVKHNNFGLAAGLGVFF